MRTAIGASDKVNRPGVKEDQMRRKWLNKKTHSARQTFVRCCRKYWERERERKIDNHCQFAPFYWQFSSEPIFYNATKTEHEMRSPAASTISLISISIHICYTLHSTYIHIHIHTPHKTPSTPFYNYLLTIKAIYQQISPHFDPRRLQQQQISTRKKDLKNST